MNLNHDEVDFIKVSDIVIPDAFYNRIKTGDPHIDSIFGANGDGILPGSTITLIAPPGCGKSTFTLTLGELLTRKGYRIGYTSGEESDAQIAYTCKRLNIVDLKISTKTDADELLIKMKDLDLLIVDSFQCLTEKTGLNKTAKVQYFIDNFVKLAKDNDCAVLFIVQLTQSGEMRGGTTLPYAVDVNIRITKAKEFGNDYRIFDVYKNRFGWSVEHAAMLNHDGYTFLGEHNLQEEIVDITATKEKVKKVPVKEQRKELILLMTDPPHITMERVMCDLDIQKQTAYALLKELENDNKIQKFGRGETAIWKNTKIETKSFLTDCLKTMSDAFKF